MNTVTRKVIQHPANSGEVAQLTKEKINLSWKVIAPFWSLKSLIAINPLQGLQDLPIEDALEVAETYFQQGDIPDALLTINRETIKWCQAYFDQGQAIITMPHRNMGLYGALRLLLPWDKHCRSRDAKQHHWLHHLPETPLEAIQFCLQQLRIQEQHKVAFLRYLLTSLSGWSAYVKYNNDWSFDIGNADIALDYLALRLILTYIHWPDVREQLPLIGEKSQGRPDNIIKQMHSAESAYAPALIKNIVAANKQIPLAPVKCDAQFVFCIDVRSEPLRRSIEQQGNYETFGFAGFFGVPVSIKDEFNDDEHPSCPVLLKPKHKLVEKSHYPEGSHKRARFTKNSLFTLKKLYQGIKYNFTTPFALAEGMGMISGFFIGLRNFFPSFYSKLTHLSHYGSLTKPVMRADLGQITFKTKCEYVQSALTVMGLTTTFAPIIVICGHGSDTTNNAFATSLDCGACGARHGASNARIFCQIANDPKVREYLQQQGIDIPDSSYFVPALHNTTTDEVDFLLDDGASDDVVTRVSNLDEMCRNATVMTLNNKQDELIHDIKDSAFFNLAKIPKNVDWAQVRPEWGLARNAAFIIAPRRLTKKLDLHGRSFLHSYDWQHDNDASALRAIMTAPMIVGHWINMQYFFSCIDNVAYGAGSKATQNIVGKLGVIQGNSSDLMHGLPLQSVNVTDEKNYHEPIRLQVIINAPIQRILDIVTSEPEIKNLVSKGWLKIYGLDPSHGQCHQLSRELTWDSCS